MTSVSPPCSPAVTTHEPPHTSSPTISSGKRTRADAAPATGPDAGADQAPPRGRPRGGRPRRRARRHAGRRGAAAPPQVCGPASAAPAAAEAVPGHLPRRLYARPDDRPGECRRAHRRAEAEATRPPLWAAVREGDTHGDRAVLHAAPPDKPRGLPLPGNLRLSRGHDVEA